MFQCSAKRTDATSDLKPSAQSRTNTQEMNKMTEAQEFLCSAKELKDFTTSVLRAVGTN